MSNEIKHLFVTLKRSFAGTRDTHINIVKSLGLRRREQTVQKANVASVRGAIDKVRLKRVHGTLSVQNARLKSECTCFR